MADLMDEWTAVDPEVMESLQALYRERPRLVLELRDMLLTESPARLDRMRGAIASGDLGELYRLAHMQRGSSLQFGAIRVAAVCEALERKSRSGDGEGCAGLVDDLGSAFREVEAILRGAFPGD